MTSVGCETDSLKRAEKAPPVPSCLHTLSRPRMSQGKAVVGILVLGVTATFGATAVYPLFIAERTPRPNTPPVRARARVLLLRGKR